MKSEFLLAFNEICESRGLPKEEVIDALKTALISAYRRDNNVSNSQAVTVEIDPRTGDPTIYAEKEVVDDVMDNRTEVTLTHARAAGYTDAEYGDLVMVDSTTASFGRIAAQTAKQVLLQRVREAEREQLYEDFSGREGELVNGTVQSVSGQHLTIGLGRTEAILPKSQQVPRERYRAHDKIRVYVLEVRRTNRGPQIFVSRNHRNLLRRLLELEVPEIYNGQVEIKSIAREAGQRSKVAVQALQPGVDPVGACVGMRGVRIQSIVRELNDEKIDVIEWDVDQRTFIAKALSPARVSHVFLDDDPHEGKTAVVIVPDDQLSLAIGREGQNARLAAKLTGWRIDIKSVTEAVQDALGRLDAGPLASLPTQQPELLAETIRIMDKKAAARTIMPEEYQTLARFADVVETRLLNARNQVRDARMAEINAVKATLPAGAFALPVTALDLPEEVLDALLPLENVGEIMWRFLIDERHLQKLLADLPAEAMVSLQSALDRLVIPDEAELLAQTVAAEAEAAEAEAAAQPADAALEAEIEAEALAEAGPATDVPLGAFGDEPEAPPVRDEEAVYAKLAAAGAGTLVEESEEEEDGDIDAILVTGKDGETIKKKKERQKRRQLVYDEELGEVVAKRRRKGARSRDDWDDYLG
jgi:N utilization substance protein A